MGKLIKVVFGPNGGRCDKKLPHDLNRAFEFCLRAASLENDPSKTELTKQLLEQAIEIDPEFTDAIIRLGNLYFSRGQFDVAASYFKRAHSIDDKCPVVLYNLGTIHLLKQELDEALFWLREAIKFDPGMAVAHHNIAVTYERAGLFMTARKYWKSFLDLVPDDPNWENIQKKLTD